jgi:A/G-specific adenine glycosylase
MPRKPDKDISRRLLGWYGRHKRDLPWRRTNDPYRIWVSEIMLQQTRVETVIPYYERFLERYPDVASLARSPLDSVLKTWEGLGYYSRARHLHEAALIVADQLVGKVPSTLEDLRKLPGVGAYTAGAILSIAFGKPVAAVDGNVIRVVARLFGIEESVDERAVKKSVTGFAQQLVPDNEPGLFNQALMDLGSGLCTPRDPDCPNCPLSEPCRARKKGKQNAIPKKKKTEAIPHREAAVAVVRNDLGQVLMVKRPQRGLLGGLWGFPGCILEKGVSPAAALRKALRQDPGLTVAVGRVLFAVEHGYSHFSIRVHVLAGTTRKIIPGAGNESRHQWVDPGCISRLALSRLEMKIIGELPALRDAEAIADGKRAGNRAKKV